MNETRGRKPPRAWLVVYAWDTVWELAFLFWLVPGRGAWMLGRLLGVDPLDVPVVYLALAWFAILVGGALLGRALVFLASRIPGLRDFLERPLASPTAIRLVERMDPRTSLLILVVFAGTLVSVSTAAAVLLSSRGILPGPGRTADTAAWAVAAIAAIVAAVLAARWMMSRRAGRAERGA